MTPEKIRREFSYIPETGALVRLSTGKAVPHNSCFSMKINGEIVPVSRVVWAHHYGAWPCRRVYAINGDRSDNRIENLMQETPDGEATGELVRKLFEYNSDTGNLLRRTRTQTTNIGDVAGTPTRGGYLCVRIGSKSYQLHRIIWLFVYNRWPDGEIDHINMVRTDNRLINLREATRKQNMENRNAKKGSRSGIRGVSWSHGKWHATIGHHGHNISLGFYDDIEEAKSARADAVKKLYTHSMELTYGHL